MNKYDRINEGAIPWDVLRCRHGCRDAVVGLYSIAQGCRCWTDPVQALCLQHAMKAQSAGPIIPIVTRFELESGPCAGTVGEDN